ncbi:glycosyltransferase [Nesterenkonia marinintestina]|uniref:glycosyltransferase n=1 Tax=Nesterenkonia marinintestina TaxID=2979865 RepID=UPI0021C1BAE9|nr:glycosyltransferase [Nesterenkonia sp. GX14115]
MIRGSSPGRVQLITHSYWPERTPPQRRWQRLVAALVADGWTVDVVAPARNPRHTPAAGQAFGRFGLRPEPGPAGEQVRRVPYALVRDSRAGRFAADMLSAALLVPRSAAAPRPDVLITTVPALPLAVTGWVAARLRGVPLVLDMRDAWPDLAREASLRAGPAVDVLESVLTGVQRRADLVVAVTSGFAERLRARGARVETISNGVDLTELPQPAAAPRRAGRLRVLYYGNHGESQGLETVIDAVRAVHRAGEVEVTLRMVGSGTQRSRLIARAADCPAVEFRRPAHGEELRGHLDWADSVLVSLRTDWPSFAWTVPSKTFELMGLGTHITAAVAGEAAEILRHAENSDVVEDADAETLAALFDRLARDPESTPTSSSGRRWVAENADLPGLGRRYSQRLRELIGAPPQTAPAHAGDAGDAGDADDAVEGEGRLRADRTWICVCTYRRNRLLAELLGSLRASEGLDTAAGSVPRLIVVDNDPEAGARDVVGELYPEAVYVHQAEPGIVAARNASLDAVPSDAEAVVFLDDDERVRPQWLAALLRAAEDSGADTVSGPVVSHLPAGSTGDSGGFIRRIDFPAGPWAGRPATNNVLVRAGWFLGEDGLRFDPDFNLTGGEDSELFSRMQAAGARSWWEPEAIVEEDVPEERATEDWMRRRGVRAGHVRAKKAQKRGRGRASILAEAAVRLGAGAGRAAARRLRRRPLRYADRIWLREGRGMAEYAWGRRFEEYARR